MRARLLALLWLVVPVHAAAAPLDGYEAYARKALADWKVPGAAIAVVKDGRVVAVTGIGVREAGKPEKVDEHTVFAIASLSKGITAASVALLVDEGKLRWDDRVIEHLPGFRVADPYVTRELTLRDLLAHRSGLTPDADWLWGLGYRPDEILARLRYATQGSSLRAAFSYQNVLYLVLGEVVAARAGMSWQRFTRERLLGPLGMNETRLTLAELAGASNVARPHSDRSGAMVPLPAHEDGDPVAPAASASSTATDLARWMRFQLGDPGVGGALVRPETREEMQAPQMLDPLGPSGRKLYPGTRFRAYAFGWVVQDHRGRTVVWNTGGLSGMTCSLALVGLTLIRSGADASLTASMTVTSRHISFATSSRPSTRPRTSTKASSVSLNPCSLMTFGKTMTSIAPPRSSRLNTAIRSPFFVYFRARFVMTPPTVSDSPSCRSATSATLQSLRLLSIPSAPMRGWSLTYRPSISFSNLRRWALSNSRSGIATLSE